MNSFSGTIQHAEQAGNFTLLSIKVRDVLLSAIVISEDHPEYYHEHLPVDVTFNETEVVISTDENPEISLRNQLPGTLTAIQKGQLLSKLDIETKIGKITSIITTGSTERLQLEVGKKVTAMIKTNEVMISY